MFDQVNARAGASGQKFDVKGFDNGGDVEKTAQQMRRAADEGVTFVINGIGAQHADAVRNFILRHNDRNPGKEIAFLSHSSGTNNLSNSKCMFYQAQFDPTIDMKVGAMIDSLAALKRGSKVFLVNPDYELGRSVEDAVKRMLPVKAPGISLVGSELMAPFGQVQDFTPIVAKIKAAGADLVISANFGPDLIRLVSAAADSGLQAQISTIYGVDPGAMGAIGKDRMVKMKLTSVAEYHENDPGKLARLDALSKEYRSATLEAVRTGWSAAAAVKGALPTPPEVMAKVECSEGLGSAQSFTNNKVTCSGLTITFRTATDPVADQTEITATP